jgi:hypothetical protein
VKQLLLIRQTSALRAISVEEVVASLSPEEQKLERKHVEVAMDRFNESVEQKDWNGQDLYLREAASTIRGQAAGDIELHYYGLAEIAQQIALGAHVGDQYAVRFHDHDRATGKWGLPETQPTLRLATSGADDLGHVKARGPVVIRVAISAVISDSDVREAIGDETLADVTISHQDPSSATVARVKSPADVELIREEFRRVYALLRNTRPNIELLHLFVAAPPSVCFAVGQELSLRNAPPVQLYRFRMSAGGSSQAPAILLSADGEELTPPPLTTSEIQRAADIRKKVWPLALKDLGTYVANKKLDAIPGARWFDQLEPGAIRNVAPFPALPLLESIVPANATVDNEPFSADYGFERSHARWRLGDRLLLGLYAAAENDDERLRELIRLFLFHEYLHRYHSITKHTAGEIGKFANCLEYLDYAADSYAILHQLDLARRYDGGLLDDQPARLFLAAQVELAINSFWAFDASTGSEWQIRRIRRYLNWYWRLIQIENAPDLETALRVFRRQPAIEIGGLYQVARGRRVIALLERVDPSTQLEIGLVLENDRFHRVADSTNTNLRELLRAFTKGDHEAIRGFFRSVYDMAEQTNGVQAGPEVSGGTTGRK